MNKPFICRHLRHIGVIGHHGVRLAARAGMAFSFATCLLVVSSITGGISGALLFLSACVR
jgi:hypothetical protein